MGPATEILEHPYAVNDFDRRSQKSRKNDPFVSTGALRSAVNTVKVPFYTPPFPLEPEKKDFTTARMVNSHLVTARKAVVSCSVNIS